MVLKGRLGLKTARVPHGDRHGCLWLGRGSLYVEDGTLRFATTGAGDLAAGDYAIPFQTVTTLILGPGTSLTHDALRICARHGAGLVFTGEDSVRFYASMPFGADSSRLARRQVELWSDRDARNHVARQMYATRLGELLPSDDLAALRGIEGSRVKALYARLAEAHGVRWDGRRYNRDDPEGADLLNQAINHATTALLAAARVAVASTSTIPQLGFIHEDSGIAFALDVADLFREEIAVDCAFAAVKEAENDRSMSLEARVRRKVGRTMHRKHVVPSMIDRIKELLGDGDSENRAESDPAAEPSGVEPA
ncbi:MAG: type I-E CRISPR-associated endonuclease Cas1 [Planctomycetes bacterium]|nr:type I-E CRISPR-associated endonuclease Cas1 [Planctomycetota bacterium]